MKLIGRLAGIHAGQAQFSGSLRNQCALADLKMNRLLDTIDEWAAENGLDRAVVPPHRFEPTQVEASPPLGLDLTRGEIRTIIWATGFRPDYSWLEVPVFDRKGRIRHDGGVVEAPGMYLMGIPFLRRRKSSLIDGAGDDARDLSAHLASYLSGRSSVLSPRATGAQSVRPGGSSASPCVDVCLDDDNSISQNDGRSRHQRCVQTIAAPCPRRPRRLATASTAKPERSNQTMEGSGTEGTGAEMIDVMLPLTTPKTPSCDSLRP